MECVRETLVTFFRGRLVIRGVRALHAPDDRGEFPMIESVDVLPEADEVQVWADDPSRLTVDALDVEVAISREPGGHVRRRAG